MRVYVFLINRLYLPFWLIMITPFASYMLGFVLPVLTIPSSARAVLFARLDCDLQFIETHLAVDPMLYATAYFSGMVMLLFSIPLALSLLFIPWNAFSGTKIYNQPAPSHPHLKILLLAVMAILGFIVLSILPESLAAAPNCSWFKQVVTEKQAAGQFFRKLGLIGFSQAFLYLCLWLGVVMYRKVSTDHVASHY